jgi:hypothetical protein
MTRSPSRCKCRRPRISRIDTLPGPAHQVSGYDSRVHPQEPPPCCCTRTKREARGVEACAKTDWTPASPANLPVDSVWSRLYLGDAASVPSDLGMALHFGCCTHCACEIRVRICMLTTLSEEASAWESKGHFCGAHARQHQPICQTGFLRRKDTFGPPLAVQIGTERGV